MKFHHPESSLPQLIMLYVLCIINKGPMPIIDVSIISRPSFGRLLEGMLQLCRILVLFRLTPFSGFARLAVTILLSCPRK
jgi:hypothetical protein